MPIGAGRRNGVNMVRPPPPVNITIFPYSAQIFDAKLGYSDSGGILAGKNQSKLVKSFNNSVTSVT